MEDEIDFSDAMNAPQGDSSAEEVAFGESSQDAPEGISGEAVEPVEAAVAAETPEVPASHDPRFTAELNAEIASTLAALELAGTKVDPEAFRAEVLRIQELSKQDEATARMTEVAETQRPYAEALVERTQLDPSDPSYLSEASAEELWAEKLRVVQLERELSERDALMAQSSREKSIERVRAEFPDADEEVLRLMADSGKSESELKVFAKRDADRIARREELAREKYAAVKGEHKKTTATSAAGVGTNAAASREMTFEESMR